MPEFDKPFPIKCNALEWAMGRALTQPYGDAWLPVSYLSKALNSAQQNYAMHNCKLYAIVVCCERWCPYIQSQRTIMLTDHEPLKHFMPQPTLSKRQAQWQGKLCDTPIAIQYHPGKDAVVLDALSRIPKVNQAMVAMPMVVN